MAIAHIQVSEPQPGVFVLNRAGVPRRLFSVPDRNVVKAKASAVVAELDSLSTEEFCNRYRIPREFLDATEPQRKRIPQLHPLF